MLNKNKFMSCAALAACSLSLSTMANAYSGTSISREQAVEKYCQSATSVLNQEFANSWRVSPIRPSMWESSIDYVWEVIDQGEIFLDGVVSNGNGGSVPTDRDPHLTFQGVEGASAPAPKCIYNINNPEIYSDAHTGKTLKVWLTGYRYYQGSK